MHTLRRMVWVGLSSALLLMAAACGDDGNSAIDAPMVDDAPPQDVAACTCDPVGPFPAQGTLLNAPLKTDVEVLDRPVRHPGCAGPTNLP